MTTNILDLNPRDGLPSELKILKRIYEFVNVNFNEFGHNKINSTYWFTPSWSPFIKYIFYVWGKDLGFTIGVGRGIIQFKEFYKKMEGEEQEERMISDVNLKEYLTIDLSWRPPNAIIPDIPNSEILFLGFEHEEDINPKFIVENTYIGAQLDEVRKLGYTRSFLKILFVRPRYKGVQGKQKKYAEHEETLKTEIEKELKRQYIEIHEKWILISVILDDIENPSEIIFHGFKYNSDKAMLIRFDEDKYSIAIDNSLSPCRIR